MDPGELNDKNNYVGSPTILFGLQPTFLILPLTVYPFGLPNGILLGLFW